MRSLTRRTSWLLRSWRHPPTWARNSPSSRCSKFYSPSVPTDSLLPPTHRLYRQTRSSLPLTVCTDRLAPPSHSPSVPTSSLLPPTHCLYRQTPPSLYELRFVFSCVAHQVSLFSQLPFFPSLKVVMHVVLAHLPLLQLLISLIS